MWKCKRKWKENRKGRGGGGGVLIRNNPYQGSLDVYWLSIKQLKPVETSGLQYPYVIVRNNYMLSQPNSLWILINYSLLDGDRTPDYVGYM